MRYSHLDLAPLFPALFEGWDDAPETHVQANYYRGDGRVTIQARTLYSPVTMGFDSDDSTPYYKPADPRAGGDPYTPWTTGRVRVASLVASYIPATHAAALKAILRPKPVSDAAVPVDALAFADALTFAAHRAGDRTVLLDAGGASSTLPREVRLWALDVPLPVGDDVLAVAPAAALWVAGAVRLFAGREGHVAGRLENRGTVAVPLWRVRVEAPSGAFVALDLSQATAWTVEQSHRSVIADCATNARATVRVRTENWPKRLTGSDLRDVVVDDTGLRLVDPSQPGSKGRRVPVEASSGAGTTCVPVDALRDALRATGTAPTMMLDGPSDPLLVSSRNGQAHIALLPWVPAALYPR